MKTADANFKAHLEIRNCTAPTAGITEFSATFTKIGQKNDSRIMELGVREFQEEEIFREI